MESLFPVVEFSHAEAVYDGPMSVAQTGWKESAAKVFINLCRVEAVAAVGETVTSVFMKGSQRHFLVYAKCEDVLRDWLAAGGLG